MNRALLPRNLIPRSRLLDSLYHAFVSPRFEICNVGVRVAGFEEGAEVAGGKLDAEEVGGVAQGREVAEHPGHVGAVDAVVGEVGITVGEAWGC